MPVSYHDSNRYQHNNRVSFASRVYEYESLEDLLETGYETNNSNNISNHDDEEPTSYSNYFRYRHDPRVTRYRALPTNESFWDWVSERIVLVFAISLAIVIFFCCSTTISPSPSSSSSSSSFSYSSSASYSSHYFPAAFKSSSSSHDSSSSSSSSSSSYYENEKKLEPTLQCEKDTYYMDLSHAYQIGTSSDLINICLLNEKNKNKEKNDISRLPSCFASLKENRCSSQDNTPLPDKHSLASSFKHHSSLSVGKNKEILFEKLLKILSGEKTETISTSSSAASTLSSASSSSSSTPSSPQPTEERKFKESIRASACADVASNSMHICMDAIVAAFGPPLVPKNPIIGKLFVYQPIDGCTYNSELNQHNNDKNKEESSWIALIQRGGCSFERKVYSAQKSGAKAVVIFNDSGTGRELLVMEPESKVKAALNQLKRFANLELYTQASSDADKELSGKKPHVTNIENREREEESDSSQPDSDEETKRKITISSVFISQESGNLLRSLIPTKDESRNNDQQQDNNDNGQYIDFEIGILGSLSAGAILLKFGYIFIPSVTLVFTIVTLLIFILRSKEVTLVRSAEETHRVLECVKEHYYPIKSAAAITSCDTCVICLDAFIEGSKVALLPCKHYYHKTCINSWLYSHNTCPICKRDFSKQLEELLSMSTNTTTSSSNSSSDAMTAEQEMSQRTSSRRATTNHTSTVTTTTTSRSPRATRTTTTTSAESGFSISQYLPDLSPLDLTETMVTSSDLSQEEVAMIISAIRAADTAEREETNRGAGSSPAQQHSWQHQQHHHHHPRLYIHSQLRH